MFPNKDFFCTSERYKDYIKYEFARKLITIERAVLNLARFIIETEKKYKDFRSIYTKHQVIEGKIKSETVDEVERFVNK